MPVNCWKCVSDFFGVNYVTIHIARNICMKQTICYFSETRLMSYMIYQYNSLLQIHRNNIWAGIRWNVNYVTVNYVTMAISQFFKMAFNGSKHHFGMPDSYWDTNNPLTSQFCALSMCMYLTQLCISKCIVFAKIYEGSNTCTI